MLVQDLIYDARALIDDYNTGGVVNPPSDTAEADTNALRYVYMGLGEIYPYARYFKTYTITQTPTEEQKDARVWIANALPTDFGTLDRIVEDTSYYKADPEYQLEANNTLYLPFWFEGTLRVVYMPKPSRLAITDELPINNPLAEQFLTYYVAAKIAIADLPDFANYFEQKANELMIMASKPQPAKAVKITDVYGTSYYG